MKRNIFIVVSILLLVYLLSYVWLRQSRIEIWEQDGKAYVIFPKDAVYLYYLYRPLSYFDGKLTGMNFHIGEHR